MIIRRHVFQEYWRRLLFRNYLIANPQVARDYESLKIALAAAHGGDRVAYTDGKSAFIASVMAEIAGKKPKDEGKRRQASC